MLTRRTIANSAMAIMAAAALVTIAFGLLIEVYLAIPLPGWLYVSAGLVILVGSVLVMVVEPLRKRIKRTSFGCLLFLAMLAAMYLVPWTSRKPFLKALDRVQLGMTRVEVEQIMTGYIRGTGWIAQPADQNLPASTLTEPSGQNLPSGKLTDLLSGESYPIEVTPNGEFAIKDSVVFRHSNHWRFNSDFGVVTFGGGKVVSVQFMPD